MKRSYRYRWVVVLLLILSLSCSKEVIVSPELVTTAFTRINQLEAITGGSVLSDGGSAIFERGVCWSMLVNPTIDDNKTVDGAGSGDFTSIITGHSSNVTYFVRAYATNGAGTAYGNNIILEMASPILFNADKTYGELSDIDGNVYRTIEIGDQIWMAENLRTTRLNDGAPITEITSGLQWKGMQSPAYCWYNNDSISYKSVYGALYNWFAVNTGKLCPEGWHTPSREEWETLINEQGGSFPAMKLREAGDSHWLTSLNVTNESGFTALPAGHRDSRYWIYMRRGAYFWTSTSVNPISAWCYHFDMNGGHSYYGNNYPNGLSVRCIQD